MRNHARINTSHSQSDLNNESFARTALEIASITGNIEVMNALLSAGANVDASNGGETALVVASRANQVEALQRLVDAGATEQFADALELSIQWGNMEVLRLLLESERGIEVLETYEEIETRNLMKTVANGATILHWAIHWQSSRQEALRLCIDRGAHKVINVENVEGLSPLLYVVAIDHEIGDNTIATMDILLGNGADVDGRDRSGQTVLHKIFNGENSLRSSDLILDKALALLVKHNFDINAPDAMGRTPCHTACCRTRVELTAILRFKLDVDRQDSDGNTPLHFATMSLDSSMIDMLSEAHANMNTLNKFGMTPLFSACLAYRTPESSTIFRK
ncbi:ankyrin [Polyplosphaeria fusca]|uniref:Ankyrin n=1 Tax=Polyplosphaeria fusca TaxID=682080 RepID=A0A9P4RCA2_9PLEO|nr:ankyrin [Polyplosphaeria fusca]